MICHVFNCPNCGDTCQDIVAEGWTAYQCNKCGLPFVAKTVMIPKISTHRIVGFESVESEPSIQNVEEIIEEALRPAIREFIDSAYPTPEEIEEDAKYCAEHPEELDEISESMKQPLTDEQVNDVRKWANVPKCVECGKPISPDSDWRLCEDCLKDDEPEQGTANSAFLNCPLSKNSLYRLDGDHIEVKYHKGAAIRTTWSDIYMLCEEENPTSTIKELLGERANTNNVAAVNAFVRAVKAGKIEV